MEGERLPRIPEARKGGGGRAEIAGPELSRGSASSSRPHARGVRSRHEKAPLSDTSDAAARVQLELIRNATPERRLQACFALSRSMIALSRAVLRDRHPDLDDLELGLKWVELNYGADLATAMRARAASRR